MQSNFHYEITGQRIKAQTNLEYAALWLFLGILMFFAGYLKNYPILIFILGGILTIAGIYKLYIGIKRLDAVEKDFNKKDKRRS